ncbi:MAG: hypothetical protein ACR2RL_14820 [Gammaproteobacteria bacterium]
MKRALHPLTGRRVAVAVVLGGVFLGGCGSNAPVPDPAPADEAQARVGGAARAAFEQGRFEQASALYAEVLELAYARDDLNAIVDAQFNAALSDTELGRYDAALERVRLAKAELARGAQAVPADLLLLEATVLYRQGQSAGAWRVTEQMFAASAAVSPAASSRAHFLRGLIAAERGDGRALAQAIVALGEPSDSRLQADLEELKGRQALAGARVDSAVTAFEQAARLRSETLDYRGTVRALSMAGVAAEREQDYARASDFYLRAGRSAASRGDGQQAREWLEHAASLAERAGAATTAREARAHLARLDEAATEENRI